MHAQTFRRYPVVASRTLLLSHLFTSSHSLEISTCIYIDPLPLTHVSTLWLACAGSLECSGTCACTPTSEAWEGVISDGPGDYGTRSRTSTSVFDLVCVFRFFLQLLTPFSSHTSLDCRWLISSSSTSAKDITLSFTEYDVYYGGTYSTNDYVIIYSCSSADCTSREELGRPLGSVSSTQSFTSTSGFLQVVMTTSSYNRYREGFVAKWSIPKPSVAFEYKCVPCGVGKYSGLYAEEVLMCHVSSMRVRTDARTHFCFALCFSSYLVLITLSLEFLPVYQM